MGKEKDPNESYLVQGANVLTVQVKVKDVYYSVGVEVGLWVVAFASHAAAEGSGYDVGIRLVYDSVGVYVDISGDLDGIGCSRPREIDDYVGRESIGVNGDIEQELRGEVSGRALNERQPC